MSLILPLAEWPDPDRSMWENLRKEAGPMDDRGALAHLRQTSCATLEARYGRWIQRLMTSDPDAFALPPVDRATVPRLQAWLGDLAHTKPMTRLMFVDGVLRILRAADPDHDWTMQRRLLAGLKRAADRGDPARKQGRILSSEVLLKAGLSLAEADADAVPNQLRRMIGQRDGMMIACWPSCQFAAARSASWP